MPKRKNTEQLGKYIQTHLGKREYSLTDDSYAEQFKALLLKKLRKNHSSDIPEDELLSGFAKSIGLSKEMLLGERPLPHEFIDKNKRVVLINRITAHAFDTVSEKNNSSFLKATRNHINSIDFVTIGDNKKMINEAKSFSGLINSFSSKYGDLGPVKMAKMFNITSGQGNKIGEATVSGWKNERKNIGASSVEAVAKTIGSDKTSYEKIYKIAGVRPLEKVETSPLYKKASSDKISFGDMLETGRLYVGLNGLHHKTLGRLAGKGRGGGRGSGNYTFSRKMVLEWIANIRVPEALAVFNMSKAFEEKVGWWDEKMSEKLFRLAIEQQKILDSNKVGKKRYEKTAETLAIGLDKLRFPENYTDEVGKKDISPDAMKKGSLEIEGRSL